MDSFYSPSFGKRKTYIVPAFFAISVITFFLSFFIDSIISNQQVVLITVVGFIIIFLVTLQDISTDAWSVTLLDEKNVAHASFIQSMGQTFGSIISFVIYLNLSN